MNNKTTQKLIVLFGAVIFSLALANSVSASVFYDPSEVSNPGINTNRAINPTASNPTTTVINNYYYQTAPTTKTNASAPATPSSNKSEDPINNLGASALNSVKNAEALSLNGNGGFMPSSIWQWILVVILILAIVIVARMFVHKPDPADHH